jgi:hypothetical protein
VPRRRRGGLEVLDELVDVAVDTAFDRAEGWVTKLRTQQIQEIPDTQVLICAGCRGQFPARTMQMVNPNGDGFGVCQACFGFIWQAGREKMRALAKRGAARAASAATGAPVPPPPERTPPWEVLGVSMDASIDEIKKAYYREAAKCHPDAIPVGTAAHERDRLKQRFIDLTNAKTAMLKVREEPK